MSKDNRFSHILTLHKEKYPDMQGEDFLKLCYQNAFGPSHLLSFPEKAYSAIKAELPFSQAERGFDVPIGNELCRFGLFAHADPDLILKLMLLTSTHMIEDKARFLANLAVLEEQKIPYSKEEVEKHCENGHYLPFSHSSSFNEKYHPHYRIMREEYALFYPLFKAIGDCLDRKGGVRVEIDGECGSGKTRLAALLAEVFGARILHIDDYYLPLAERVPNWKSSWGGNIDFPRFANEVINHLDEDILLHAYSCHEKRYLSPVLLKKTPVTVVEGSYSGVSQYASAFDIKVFLACSSEVKTERLMEREGNYYNVFTSTWIPLEESYLRFDEPEKRATLKFDTSSL